MREDVKLLTYDEIADLFGIERESARHLVLRKQWRRTKGNDGKARIEVPLDALPVPRTGEDTVECPSPDADDGTSSAQVLARHIERLELALEAAQERLSETEAARDEARDKARAMERERDEARAEARVITAQVEALNTILAVERERTAAERVRVEEWKAVADRFAGQAEQMLTAQARRSWWPWRRAS